MSSEGGGGAEKGGGSVGGGSEKGGGGGGSEKGGGGGGAEMGPGEFGSGTMPGGAGPSPEIFTPGGEGGGGAIGYAPTEPGIESPFPNIGGGGGFNLAGPGPIGGEPGLPGEGGGSNQPWANIPGLEGNEFNYLGLGNQPVTAGGVSSTGVDPGAGGETPNGAAMSLNELFGGEQAVAAAAPPGPGASALAAPASVSGLPELGNKETSTVKAGGTNQTKAVESPGLLESLGLNNTNKLGAAAAGAGLINSILNGNKTPEATQALKNLAMQLPAIQAGAAAQSGVNQKAGGQAQTQGLEQVTQGQTMTREGQALQQYVQTGTLPEGYESQIQSGVQAAITRLKSNYANRGLPTDPALNSTLAEEIRQIEHRVPELRMQMAQSLATTGTGIVGAGNQTISTGGGLLGTGTQTSNSLVESGIKSAGLSAEIYKILAGLNQQSNTAKGQAIANFAAALNNTPKKAVA